MVGRDDAAPTRGGSLVVGVDVGGTNTDSALLDLSKPGPAAVVASHKAPSTANVTLSVQETLRALLADAAVRPADVAALAIGTTHFVNALVERDASRVEKVAVLRLASHGFSAATPPFADWPAALRRLVEGYSAILPGGCNIDGTPIGPVDEDAVRAHAARISAAGLRNVVVVGIGSPMDGHGDAPRQEDRVARLLRAELGTGMNVVCSHTVAGAGLLARENASILNASILTFARRTIRAFIGAMRRVGLLRCPLYLTSNSGHLLPFSAAMATPIHIFSSGPTNSMRGAAFLTRDDGADEGGGGTTGRAGSVVVDIGGTTTDVGYLLRNGYPRLAGSSTALAGVRVNLEMPSVESVGLGGGSVLHVGSEATSVRVGPDSVGHELPTKALCFGGTTATATDVAVALGAAKGLGTRIPSELAPAVLASAQTRIKRTLESAIDRVKPSPEPCTVVLVGGGAILCPPREQLAGVARLALPPHAGVANAIGAAIARIHGAAETVVHGPGVAAGVAAMKAQAVRNAVAKGAVEGAKVTVLLEEASGVPYVEGQTLVRVEVACPADHARVYAEMLAGASAEDYEQAVGEEETSSFEETKCHDGIPHRDGGGGGTHHDDEDQDDDNGTVDCEKYRPNVDAHGQWTLSETDLRFMAIGCYILGCGGGGSPYAPFLELRQLLLEGETVRLVRCEDLRDDDLLPPVASVGTPAVSIERPGGDGVYHSMQEMEKLIDREDGGGAKSRFTKLLAIEIGGANGVGTLVWGSSRYYDIPTVDGDLMGRAYPNFEMVSQYVKGDSIDDLFPVTLCSGTGDNVIIPAGHKDAASAGAAIRSNLMSMGSAAGATGNPITGALMRSVGIPNTYSLAWRLGRAVLRAQQWRQWRPRGSTDAPSGSSVVRAIIDECGGSKSARLLFRGKIKGVESRVTTTAHSIGRVTVGRLSSTEAEDEHDTDTPPGSTIQQGPGEDIQEVEVPFMNENLSVVGKRVDGSEQLLATVPDLIFLLDSSTGENVGVQEYRYGLRVMVMIMAPHPVWLSDRGLEVAGPKAFGLPYDYAPTLEYTKPRSVIDEFIGGAS